jgi:hypothetical protein
MPLRIETVSRDSVVITATMVPAILWRVGPFRQQQGGRMPIEVDMNWEQEFDAAITPQTLGGSPAPIDGAATWEADSPGCTVTSTGDLTSTVRGVPDALGDVLITCTVDADLGAGFVALKDTILVHLTSPMAGSLGMTVTPPRQQ